MTFNGIDIEVERKPIKNLHLAVYPPDGRVHVSAPENYTNERIKLFILKKWVWIIQTRCQGHRLDSTADAVKLGQMS